MVKSVIILLIAFLFLGCSSPGDFANREMSPEKYPYRVFILNQGWHTGIVLKVSEVSETDMPEINEFKGSEFIDVGWGDELYYQIPGYDLTLAARALFSPTSSALKIRTLNIPVEMYYETFRFCLSFDLSEQEYKKLCRYISRTFKKTGGKPLLLDNRSNIVYFYKAEGDYHLFNTCNTWVVDALNYSGIPVETTFVISASDLFDAIKDYGKVLVNKY